MTLTQHEAAQLVGAKDSEIIDFAETDEGIVVHQAGGPPVIVIDGAVMLLEPVEGGARLPVYAPPVDDEAELDDEPADDEPPAKPATAKKTPPAKPIPAKPTVAGDD